MPLLVVPLLALFAFKIKASGNGNQNNNSSTATVSMPKEILKTEIILCGSETYNDANLNIGTRKTVRQCVNGSKTVKYQETVDADGTVSQTKISETINIQPVAERIAIGTRSCDSNYSGCVPITNYDLDCSDIGTPVFVYGYDKHHLDGDGDGIGCESYY